MKIGKITDNMTKYKIQANTSKANSEMLFIPHFYSLLIKTFHFGQYQSSRGFLDVWKHDWAFRVLGQWFQM